MKRRMRQVYAIGHHHGGYDGDDYDELCEYEKDLYRKLEDICDKIEDHPEHHRRGYSSRSYSHRGSEGGHRESDYDMYDEGHRRGRRGYSRRGEHYVRGHYSR